jgi:hypothetical protein
MEEQNAEGQPLEPLESNVEQPQMSEVATLGNIFFEPERTFKDLKIKPRFIIASIIMVLLVTAYQYGLTAKVGEEGLRNFIEEQIDKSPTSSSLSSEQKKDAVALQMKISKYSSFAVPVFVLISFLIGALLYWGGAKAFGGTGTFLQNLSVWVYSGLPPLVVAMIANFIVLALKSADDIDLGQSQRGLLHANPSFFIDGKAHPIIATMLSTFDAFAIWGWILAVIGLTAVNRISKTSSWAVVLIIVVIGLAFRMLGAVMSGNPS